MTARSGIGDAPPREEEGRGVTGRARDAWDHNPYRSWATSACQGMLVSALRGLVERAKLTQWALSEVKSNRVLSREAKEELSKASPMAHLKVRPHHQVAAYLSDRLYSAILRHNKSHGRF